MLTLTHHVALYNGKRVVMDYVDPRREFALACMRIRDNGAEGYVVTPDGKVYRVSQLSKLAAPLMAVRDADEMAHALAWARGET